MAEPCYKPECRIPSTFDCDDCGKRMCVAHCNFVPNPNKNQNLFLCDECKEQRIADEAMLSQVQEDKSLMKDVGPDYESIETRLQELRQEEEEEEVDTC